MIGHPNKLTNRDYDFILIDTLLHPLLSFLLFVLNSILLFFFLVVLTLFLSFYLLNSIFLLFFLIVLTFFLSFYLLNSIFLSVPPPSSFFCLLLTNNLSSFSLFLQILQSNFMDVQVGIKGSNSYIQVQGLVLVILYILKEGLYNLEFENQGIGDEGGLFQDCENCLYRGKAINLHQANFQNFVVVAYPLSTMFQQ